MIHQLTLARSADLARTGDLAAAEALLRTAGELPKDSATLDLAARLRAQQGDYSGAEHLWKQVLKSDPGNPAAIAGIRRIHRRRSAGWGHRLLIPAAILLAAWIIGSISIRTSRLRALEAQQLSDSFASQGVSIAASIETQRQQLQADTQMLAKNLTETRQALEQKSAAALASLSGATQSSQSVMTARLDAMSGNLARLEKLTLSTEQIAKSGTAQAAASEKLESAQTQFATATAASFQSLTQSLQALQDKLTAIEETLPKSLPPPPPPANKKANGSE